MSPEASAGLPARVQEDRYRRRRRSIQLCNAANKIAIICVHLNAYRTYGGIYIYIYIQRDIYVGILHIIIHRY